MNMSMSMSMSSTSASGSLIGRAAPIPVRVSPMALPSSSSIRPPPPSSPVFCGRIRVRSIRCEVAVEESSMSTSAPKIGARVRVKVPLKVYHVPRVPEVDLTGMEGQIKQYVALWNGKRISANLPYKVEFLTDIPGRGPVKFFAHLKEDEFEYL